MAFLPLRILLAEIDGNSIKILLYCELKCNAQVSLKLDQPEFMDTNIPGAKYKDGELLFNLDSTFYGSFYINFLTKPKLEKLEYKISFMLHQILGERGAVKLLSGIDHEIGGLVYDFKVNPDGYRIEMMTIRVESEREVSEVSSTFGLTFINGNKIITKKTIENETNHTLRLRGLRMIDVRYIEFITKCISEGSLPMTPKSEEGAYRLICPESRHYSEVFSKPIRWIVLPLNCRFIIKQPYTISGQLITLTPPSYNLEMKFKKEESRDVLLLF